MKKLAALILAAMLLAACIPALADGDLWYCPVCDTWNTSNYCPNDGTSREAGYNYVNGVYVPNTAPSQSTSNNSGNYTQYANITGTLNKRLSTRTGPSTKYDEPGSFLRAGDRVTVLSKAWDDVNEIWWLQVEFRSQGQKYRAYTGLQRFSDVNINYIPEEYPLGTCTIGYEMEGYYGPSYDYRAISRKLPAGVQCTIYGYAPGDSSDFIQVEFFDQGLNQMRRAWVPDWSVNNLYMYYGF